MEYDFFRQIILDIIPDIAFTDEERIKSRCKAVFEDDSKQAKPIGLVKDAIDCVGIDLHPNWVCPEISHVPVFQQSKEGLCGYYMYYNAKKFTKSLLAKTRHEQLLNLCLLNSPSNFYKELQRLTNMLLACKNTFYVNPSDRELIETQTGSLDREHLDYLLQVDPEMKGLLKNKSKTPVYMASIEYSFGLLHRTNE